MSILVDEIHGHISCTKYLEVAMYEMSFVNKIQHDILHFMYKTTSKDS